MPTKSAHAELSASSIPAEQNGQSAGTGTALQRNGRQLSRAQRAACVDGKPLTLRVVYSSVAINPQLVSLSLLLPLRLRLLLSCHAKPPGRPPSGPLHGDVAVGSEQADKHQHCMVV